MLLRRFSLTALTVLLASCVVAVAGGRTGDFSFGVTTVLPGPGFKYTPWFSQEIDRLEPGFPTFTFRYWSSETFTIEPSFGVIYIAYNHGIDKARLVPGLGLAYHFRPNTNMRPYVAFQVGLDMETNGEARTDVILGPAFGAEYFFSDRFSISGEYRFAFVVTDEDSSPSPSFASDATYVITFQLLSLHFYL